MFTSLREQVQKRFAELTKNSNYLFVIDCDKALLFDIYLTNFDESVRQEHNCNCCRSFIKEIGGVVSIKDGKVSTIWDFEPLDSVYKKSVEALRAFVCSQNIKNVYYNEQGSVGVESNFDKKRKIAWDHFYLSIPRNFVKNDTGKILSDFEADKNVLERSLNEITKDAIETVLELINQGSLYRGNEYLSTVTKFNALYTQYHKISPKNKDAFLWEQSRIVGSSVARIKNTSIGTLLDNLSKGEELDKAVRMFESVVAPANYKRPKALVTPKMVEAAKKELEEKGLLGAIKRRHLTMRDLSVNNSIFVHRSNTTNVDIFDTLSKETIVNPKQLSKVEEVSIDDFVNKVLPTVSSVRALVENDHFGNFVSLVGPQSPDEKSLFKWDNNVSWSYSGEVADSIKQKVKNAGGNVTGKLRVSLAWNNYDDLDLHIFEPNGYEIFFRNRMMRSPSGGMLDVDMNAGVGTTREPVENITWLVDPTKFGTYKIVVNNYCKRESDNTGFTVEVEYSGEVYTFNSDNNGPTTKNHPIVEFTFDRRGFVINGKSSQSTYNSKEKWGIKTGQWTKVNAITLSPNYWNNQVGNKHFMFFLENCVADEKVRPFYNEFLSEDLLKNKKVFELLGGKLDVEKLPGELSGVGFSETVRNHLFVEVEGKFKRVIKVKF
jgi:hypothetical protein